MLEGKIEGYIKMGELAKSPIIKRGVSLYPLPFGDEIFLEGEWFVSFKFISTRGGGAKWRIATPYKKEQFLTLGYYCPVWKAIVKNPAITWLVGKEFTSLLEKYPLWQKFLPGYSPYTRGYLLNFASAESIPTKRILSQINKPKSPPEFKQGHLEVWRLEGEVKMKIEKELDEGEEFFFFHRKRIFNHCLIGGRLIALNKRNDDIDYAIGILYQWRKGFIVSNNHLWSPLHIEEGIYLIIHPFPEGVD